MKFYIIETQDGPDAKKRPVTMKGKTRTFASVNIAIRMGRLIKEETGHIVIVVSKGQEGQPEVFEI